MENSETLNKCLANFNNEVSHDASFDLYNNLKPSEFNDKIDEIGNKFENIYYINCSVFSIDERKDIPEIYEILKRYQNGAEGRSLEILIGEYNQETLDFIKEKNEELKKQFEGLDMPVSDPKKYMHIVGYYGGTLGRTIQEVIRIFKEKFPEKIKTLSPYDIK